MSNQLPQEVIKAMGTPAAPFGSGRRATFVTPRAFRGALMRNSCKPLWGIFLAALIVGPVYGFKPLPPPQTLEITVRNATLIFVGTGVELLSIDRAGKLISLPDGPPDALARPYYLRTHVERILYGVGWVGG